MKKYISLLLLLSILASMLTACGSKAPVSAAEPLEVPQPENVSGKDIDPKFDEAYMALTTLLLQQAAEEKHGENLLVSPLSVQMALAMTANGAAGKTREEMENVLGQGIPVDELNQYLYSYLYDSNAGVTRNEACKLQIANSIWFRDHKQTLQVEESFLQDVSDYYAADVYLRAFDSSTVKEINAWANEKTDGMIPEILDKIDSSNMLYLINAITFDAQWADPYVDFSMRDGDFTTFAGKKQNITMMHGSEGIYLEDNRATGFMKPYEGGRFAYAVLLPNEGTDLFEYVSGLTADSLAQTLSEARSCEVITQMPKFSYEFEVEMSDMLKTMGMPTAFDTDQADLSKMASCEAGNLFVGRVLHKTFIRVDGKGTQAGAITMVDVPCGSAMEPERVIKEVIVDRPFVYMILDVEDNLPIFIGCVTEITE